MSILFIPSGSLDIAEDAPALPDDGFARCKNLRIDDKGFMTLRDGSYKLNVSAVIGTMDFIIEQGGVRYLFGGKYIYRNETLITTGIQVKAPEFSPAAGKYAADQEVTITSDTPGTSIFYTLDGTDPDEGSNRLWYHYGDPIPTVTVPLYTTLKAIAYRAGFLDSDITTGYYSSDTAGSFVTETDTDALVTETDGKQLVTELY